MASVRSDGNKATELKLVRIMRAYRIIGWRRGQTAVGRPDFLFRRQRLAVFVDGCFWQGCPTHCRMPGSNSKYWRAKIQRNRARDRSVAAKLRLGQWRVVRIWEHELKRPARVAKRLLAALHHSFSVVSASSSGSRASPAFDTSSNRSRAGADVGGIVCEASLRFGLTHIHGRCTRNLWSVSNTKHRVHAAASSERKTSPMRAAKASRPGTRRRTSIKP